MAARTLVAATARARASAGGHHSQREPARAGCWRGDCEAPPVAGANSKRAATASIAAPSALAPPPSANAAAAAELARTLLSSRVALRAQPHERQTCGAPIFLLVNNAFPRRDGGGLRGWGGAGRKGTGGAGRGVAGRGRVEARTGC